MRKTTDAKQLLRIVDPRPGKDPDFERWLTEKVVPVYDAMKANPERGIPAEKVFAEMRAKFKTKSTKKRPRRPDRSA